MPSTLTAEAVVLPDRVVRPGWVTLAGKQIVDAGGGVPPRPVDEHLPGTLLPGFIDVHCHGGGGHDVADPDRHRVAAVVAAHLAHGTTTLCASLVSAAPARLMAATEFLADCVRAGLIAGVHLEGPWISPDFAGAHDRSLLRPPDPVEVAEVIAAGQGAISMVTIAPELPGAISAIEQLTAAGIAVAVGHTGASYAQTTAAIDAGATVATHLANAMRGFHHRDPGPVPALTADPRVHSELVLDGRHLDAAAAGFLARAATGRVLLVSDAMAAAAGPDGGYRLGSRRVDVRAGAARLTGDGALAGSTLTMEQAVRFAVCEVGMSLPQASRAASGAPAALLGIEHTVGSIAAGLLADLVLIDRSFRVLRVWQGGAERARPLDPVGSPVRPG